ncbi:MAG: heparan-alpha-glucosaminide N-acetyltransferase domain-containing protein [Promethearchaeota archaeon]|jgi:uncharacterized membrane protein
MKRVKSIDVFRGLGMVYIMVGHMIDWWSRPADDWLFFVHVSLFSALGAAGFVFISGVSTMISYRKRMEKTRNSEVYNNKSIRNEYLIRGILVLGLGLVYNCIVAIQFFDPFVIWKWFIILTVGGCLLLAWPFLKTSKTMRIILGIFFWIVNQILLFILLPYEGKSNISGLLFYIFYNSLDQNPILSFFTFFLIGTVVGDLFYDFSSINDENERKLIYRRKILIPLFSSSVVLTITGLLFLFPSLFTVRILTIKTNVWWLLYSLGLDLLIILIFFYIEEFKITKIKKNYRFLYYFSYYSLTLFLVQNINYFLFYDKLNRYNIFFLVSMTVIIYGLILRFLYKKLGGKFSLKVQIGILAKSLAGKRKRIIIPER